MEISKIFTIICASLLALCLTIAVTTLTVLRNATDESRELQKEMLVNAEELESCITVLNDLSKEESIPTGSTPSAGNNTEEYGFVLREANGMIGIYAATGELISTLDISINSLPEGEREALAHGIEAKNLKELLQLIEDYRS